MTTLGLWLRAVEVGAWLVALTWALKVLEAAIGLPRVANLLEDQYDRALEGLPSLTVIVPARNEMVDICACLESLLGQEYPGLRVVAVNDRSIDATGAMMEAVAEVSSGRLQVKHVVELPDQWLGKTHAMAIAAMEADAEWLLFTDADVLFRADSLRRSMAYAMETGADHLVTVPTAILKRWDEGAMLGFFQIFGLWAARPWKVADPKAQRDVIGIGAFNLIRRSAYEQVGGFEALRMEIVEDIGLGRRIKRAGLRQRVAFGRGLVRVHWAAGATGLVGVLTKNLFSAFKFYVSLALLACAWLVIFCVAPVFGLLMVGTRVPAVVTLAAVGVAYRLYGRTSGISAWQALLSPFAAMMFVYSLLLSMLTTLQQGGVMWRGTFYSLAELRKHAAPLRAPRAERIR